MGGEEGLRTCPSVFLRAKYKPFQDLSPLPDPQVPAPHMPSYSSRGLIPRVGRASKGDCSHPGTRMWSLKGSWVMCEAGTLP